MKTKNDSIVQKILDSEYPEKWPLLRADGQLTTDVSEAMRVPSDFLPAEHGLGRGWRVMSVYAVLHPV